MGPQAATAGGNLERNAVGKVKLTAGQGTALLVLRAVSAVVVVVPKAASAPESVRQADGFNAERNSWLPLLNVREPPATSALLMQQGHPPDSVRQADGLCVCEAQQARLGSCIRLRVRLTLPGRGGVCPGWTVSRAEQQAGP